jgi:two-component system OmpR family response regulator
VPGILVVDDEPQVRAAVVRILSGWGFRVREAETAQEGMAVLTSFIRERPQLVIIDIILPDGSGVQLARQIREEFPDQRILHMSGYAREVVAGEGLSADEEFLPKPFTPEQLVEKVMALTGRPAGRMESRG